MFRRLFVPVDGSELTERAVRASVDLARQLGATIVGFVAEPLPAIPTSRVPRERIEEDLREHEALTRAHAQPVLDRFEAAAREAGVAFEGRYDQVARIDDAICSAAEAHNCDMIVMVTHGRGALGEFFFGSRTKDVMAQCRVPLLVLH